MTAPKIQIVSDTRFRDHRGPDGHPERPERLMAADTIIDTFRDRIEFATPRLAETDEILRVHDRRLFDMLKKTNGQRLSQFDPDTYVSPLSYDVARLAAGSCIDLCIKVLGGELNGGLAAIRPPGHHAEADRSMGFCLFNNVAIAIRAIQSMESTARILVVDWDVHHGNGTQHIFETDPLVLYISTHQFPFYPGTGDFGEAGLEAGLGSTINIPMPAGCGDEEFIGVFQRIVVPAALDFKPDLILISCGFDAHSEDPLASMELSQQGYRVMSELMTSLAASLCDGRIVFVLEGGYSLEGVREGTEAVLESLTRRDPSPPAPAVTLRAGSTLKNIVDGVCEVHRRRIKGLGAA
ncbi:MAG: histone deacetylase [Myxococcota bacterium]